MYQPSASVPVLFLNSLEHEGKHYIRIWHKSHPVISKRLKESSIVKFSKTYKCYVTHKTPQAIEQLHQCFQGVALVDTRYLNRPKRLRPALGTVVTGANRQSEPLGKLLELPVVRLQPLFSEGREMVQVFFQYNETIYSGVATFDWRVFDRQI